MLDFFLWTGVAILVTSLICLYRVLFGPTIVDRIIGVNVIGTKTIALILIVGFLFEQVDMFIDIAFTYALINFIGTIAFT
jgi:multicomponent Na+:H+ antiporter subunit F